MFINQLIIVVFVIKIFLKLTAMRLGGASKSNGHGYIHGNGIQLIYNTGGVEEYLRKQMLYNLYWGIFIDLPPFNADLWATIPETVKFSAMAISTIGFRS